MKSMMDLTIEFYTRWLSFEAVFHYGRNSHIVFPALDVELTLPRLLSLHLKTHSILPHYDNITEGNICLPPWKTNELFELRITNVPIDWNDSSLAKNVSRFDLEMNGILGSGFRIKWSRLVKFLACATELKFMLFNFECCPILQFPEQADFVDNKLTQFITLHSLSELHLFLEFVTFTELWPRISAPNLKRVQLGIDRGENYPTTMHMKGMDSLTHLILDYLYCELGVLLGTCHFPRLTYLDVHIDTQYSRLWGNQEYEFVTPSLSVLVVRLRRESDLRGSWRLVRLATEVSDYNSDHVSRFLNKLRSPSIKELTLATPKLGRIRFCSPSIEIPILSTLTTFRMVNIHLEENLIEFFLQMPNLVHLHLEVHLSADGDSSLFVEPGIFEDTSPASSIVLPCLRTMSLSYIPEDTGLWEVPASENESLMRVMKQRFQIGKPIETLSFNGKISETLLAMLKPYVRSITSDSPLVSVELEAVRK